MPTIPLRVQQNGSRQDQVTVFGETFAYLAVDDSDGVTHDSAATYIRLPNQTPSIPTLVSFPLFLQAEGLLPLSITLNVVAQRVGVGHPRLNIGFYKGGATGFDATLFDPTASWSLAQRTFSTNPLTGKPWSVSDPIGLEAALQSETGVFGANDITLISGSITYAPVTNVRHRIQKSAGEQ